MLSFNERVFTGEGLTKLERYQDYVIKDGRLVGQFEDMYQNYTDPWSQTTREKNALEKFIGIKLLSKYGHKHPIEYGCGLGEYTQKMFEKFGSSAGVDISETAIRKAKNKYTGPSFYKGDLLERHILNDFQPDCICMVEITWYVLEKLKKFKRLITETNKGNGFFHTLRTYAPEQQKYGIKYFTNLDEIKEYWSDVIDIYDWGQIANTKLDGGYRTFFYGKIK